MRWDRKNREEKTDLSIDDRVWKGSFLGELIPNSDYLFGCNNDSVSSQCRKIWVSGHCSFDEYKPVAKAYSEY